MPLLRSRNKQSSADASAVKLAMPFARDFGTPKWDTRSLDSAFEFLKYLLEQNTYDIQSVVESDGTTRIVLLMENAATLTDGSLEDAYVLFEGPTEEMKYMAAYARYLMKTIIVVDDYRRSLVPGAIHCTRANQAVSLLRRFADEGRVVDELWLDHWLDPGSVEPVIMWLLRNKHAKQHGVPQLQIEAIYVHASDYSKREETVKRLSGQYKNVSSRDLPDRRECLPDLFTQDEMWQY